jgi:membrane protease subunit HflC
MNSNNIKVGLLAIVGLAIVLVYGSAYVVDETEQVVVTQFGRIVGEPKKRSRA